MNQVIFDGIVIFMYLAMMIRVAWLNRRIEELGEQLNDTLDVIKQLTDVTDKITKRII